MTVKLHFIPFMTLLFIILLAGCGGGPQNGSNQGEIPLVPVEMVQQMGGVSHFRAPIQIEDTQLQLFEYDANGERQMGLYSEVVFPVDVMVAYFETTDSVVVYLRRSPHGGCIILWDAEENWFHDPCFGSRFDLNGRYLGGPSQRNLDQLVATTRDGIVWVQPEVIYGEPHP